MKGERGSIAFVSMDDARKGTGRVDASAWVVGGSAVNANTVTPLGPTAFGAATRKNCSRPSTAAVIALELVAAEGRESSTATLALKALLLVCSNLDTT